MSKKLFRLSGEYKSSRESKIAKALEAGCDVIIGDPRHLLLDFDDCEGKPDLTEKLRWLKQFLWVKKVESWRSYSGEGWHVYISLARPLEDIFARIGLQAILGSDWKREMLGMKENIIQEKNEPFLIKPGIKRVVEMYRERPLEKPYTEHVECHCKKCEKHKEEFNFLLGKFLENPGE